MGLLEAVEAARTPRLAQPERTEARMSLDDYFAFAGMSYPLRGTSSYAGTEEVENLFVAYVQRYYKSDGIVYACVAARRLIFSGAWFMWQRLRGGQPGELFSTPELDLLRRPWPNGTSLELLSRMEQDVSLAGNFYAVREPGQPPRLRRLRPDWVSIVLTAPPAEAVESDVAGYLYRPGGTAGAAEGRLYLPEEVVHWSPDPDPDAQYRGMSWLTPVAREIQADKAATEHKALFFDNGATLSTIISLDPSVTKDGFKRFMSAFEAEHGGVANAYRPLFVGGGADVKVVGADMKQLDLKATQGASETRIATAARVPAVVLGISEGLAGSSLNAGNFKAAKRSFQDGFLHPQWASACAALEGLLRPPGSDVRLWYDPSHIPFLRDDEEEQAQIRWRDAATLRQLADAGVEWDAAVEFVQTGDVSRLRGRHSGLFSVQLQPPKTNALPAGPEEPDEDEPDEGGDTEDGDDGNPA